MNEEDDVKAKNGTRIVDEVHQSHGLLKWIMGVTASTFGIMVLGGVAIWVNDANQDRTLIRHEVQLSALVKSTQTRYAADLQLKLLEQKIENAKLYNSGVKASISRIENDLRSMSKEVAGHEG